MTENLLVNGDFTADWGEQESHRAWACRPGTVPQIAQIGNIFSPPGWDAWFRHEPEPETPGDTWGKWDQPEVRDATDDRDYDGHNAMMLFTFSRKHWGGFLQVVPTVPGRRYRLTAWAHAWSNSKDGPHKDDPRWSEGPGYGAGYLSPPSAMPPADSPGTADDWRNFAFNCGLDPNGGVNPFDASVRWGPGASIYNAYAQVPAVEVEATGPVMTVWLRSRTLWPFKHNDAYWGAAILEDVTPEPEPEPPVSECEARARVPYDRTTILLPPDAGNEWVRAIGTVWDIYRYTIGSSADDAGVGCGLNSRTVLAVNPQNWPSNLEQFYTEYYPGVDYYDIVAKSPADLAVQLCKPLEDDIALSQNDPRWKNTDLGEAPGGETIGQAGCLLTTLAMMLRQEYNCNVTPPVLNQLLADAEVPFVNDDLLTNWRDTIALFSVLIDSRKANGTYSAAQLQQLLLDGWLVGLMRADGKHFVYLENVTDTTLNIIDPWDGRRKTWVSSQVGGIRAARTTTDSGGQPSQPPEPPASFNPRVLTLHLQQDVEAAQRFVSTCKPSAIKRVLGAQSLPTYAALNPGMRCIYRGMDESEDPIRFIDMHIATLTQVADMFEQRGLPKIDGKYFWFELWNEVYGYDREPNIMWRDREIAATLELARREPRVGVVAFNAGVGNIHPPNFDVLVSLAQTVAANQGMFGLHSYFGVTPTSCTMDNYQDEGRWLESRWEMTDDYLVARGIKVNWFLSEGGAIYYQPPTNMPYSSDGWKHPNCLGGDWSKYLARLEQLVQRFYQQNQKRGGRLKGYTIFTQGGGTTWNKFELGSAEVDALAAMQTRLWPV